MANNSTFTKTLATADDDGIAASQSPAAAAFTINGAAASGGVATIDSASTSNVATGRRVIITSAGDNSGISFIVTGTNSSGTTITDTFAGTNTGAAQSNLDFVTVTRIIGSAAVTGAVKAGTNGVGSSAWQTINYMGNSPINVGVLVELVSGSANFSVQISYDNPNNLPADLAYPTPVSPTAFATKTATTDGALTTAFIAIRLLINSGTGVLRTRIVQAGIG